MSAYRHDEDDWGFGDEPDAARTPALWPAPTEEPEQPLDPGARRRGVLAASLNVVAALAVLATELAWIAMLLVLFVWITHAVG